MKKYIIILTCFIAIQCVADEQEEMANAMLIEWANEFASILNLPSTNFVHSPVWTNLLFATSDIITTNSLEIKKIAEYSEKFMPVYFTVSSNNVIVAHGGLYECNSFELARISYIILSMSTTMPIELIAERYELLPNGVGDFRLKEKPNIIYPKVGLIFVRGGKAIGLTPEPGVDIQPIAETLDALLMSPL